jgi:hypothetical protein
MLGVILMIVVLSSIILLNVMAPFIALQPNLVLQGQFSQHFIFFVIDE